MKGWLQSATVWEPDLGTTIDEAVGEALKMCLRVNGLFFLKFNDRFIPVKQGDNAKALTDFYRGDSSH